MQPKISHLEVENGNILGLNTHFAFTLNLFMNLYGRVQIEIDLIFRAFKNFKRLQRELQM